jgi:hypothetical protein
MRSIQALCGVAMALALAGCQQAEDGPWFKGDFTAALAAAEERGTIVFLDFYSDG